MKKLIYEPMVLKKRMKIMTCEDFKIIKTFKLDDPKEYNWLKLKLQKISTESFGRILIPDFKVKEHGNGVLEYESDYIKGHTASSKEMKIVYEDVVLRDKEWSLTNYHPDNYIVDRNGFIFYIDLEDYGKMTILDRKKRFGEEYKNYVTLVQQELDGLLEWTDFEAFTEIELWIKNRVKNTKKFK